MKAINAALLIGLIAIGLSGAEGEKPVMITDSLALALHKSNERILQLQLMLRDAAQARDAAVAAMVQFCGEGHAPGTDASGADVCMSAAPGTKGKQ